MKTRTKVTCGAVKPGLLRLFDEWIEKRDIPLKHVAADFGLTIPAVCLWRKGKRCPSRRNLKRIIEYTGMPSACALCDRPDCTGCDNAPRHN